jgi:DNA-binding transcriptional LysR family regulator
LIQMNEHVEISELVAFTKIVELRSLSRAAAQLRIPRATLGRRLARLEERLGTRLLRRTTRSLALTDDGETFLRHASIVLDAVRTAEASIHHDGAAISGDLRVSVPPIDDEGFFTLLTDFARQHPAVRLHVHFSTRHVDVRRDGYDVALRAGQLMEPGLVVRTLMRSQVVAVASPAYLAEKGVPRTRKDLRSHRCLMGFARGEVPQTHWPTGKGQVHVEGAFFTNEIRLLADAALRGMGIALLPLGLVETHVASGELVQVLAGTVGAANQVAIVYPDRQHVPPQVRAFVDVLSRWAPANLPRSAPRPSAKGSAAGARKRVPSTRA